MSFYKIWGKQSLEKQIMDKEIEALDRTQYSYSFIVPCLRTKRRWGMTQEIKKCFNPECNQTQTVRVESGRGFYFVNCLGCGIQGPVKYDYNSAVESWNRITEKREQSDASEAQNERIRTWFKERTGIENGLLAEYMQELDEIIKDLREVTEVLQNEQDYDPGLLNDYGGGDINWWQDYIRYEVDRCNEYWRSSIGSLLDEK